MDYYIHIKGRPGVVAEFTGDRCERCGSIHQRKNTLVRSITWMEALRNKSIAVDVPDVTADCKTGQK